MRSDIRDVVCLPKAQAQRLLAGGLCLWSCAIFLLLAVGLAAGAAPPKAIPENDVVRLPLVEGKDVRFTHYSTEQGLSQSRVDHLLQDAQGFVWIATYNGLNRFDGYRFQIYKPEINNPNSLGGALVYALFQDRSGVLWIGVDQGLERFDPATQRFTHFYSNPRDPASPSGHVEHITQDRDGMLWLATRDGLDRLDPKSLRFDHYRNDPNDPHSLSSNDTRFVLEDRQGTLWVATAVGPDAIDRRTGNVIRHYPSPYPSQTPLDRILEDRSGTLWFSATRAGGISSLDRKTGVFTIFTFFNSWPGTSGLRGCSAILEDHRGMMWLATYPDGLLRFDRNRREFTQYRNDPTNPRSLDDNDVLSLIEDREGGIWVGTVGGGVNRFSNEPSPFINYRAEPGKPNSLAPGVFFSAFKDSQQDLWIGTDKLNRLNRKTGRYMQYRHDPSDPTSIGADRVSSIVEDREGFLWFGTFGGGLNRFDRRTGKFKAFRHDPANSASLSHDFVRSLLLDHEGNIWAGTEDGLSRMDMHTGRFTNFRFTGPIESRIYRTLAEGMDGAIWMGTYEWGLERLDVHTGKIVAYSQNPNVRDSLSNNRVNALCIDRSGTLWVGTQNGLDRFDPQTGRFTVFSERDGLANSAVEGILEDSAGNLWVSTGRGLSKFDPHAKTFKNYYAEDGLAGDEFNDSSLYFKSADGEMFFGGVNGVTAFYPEKVIDRPYIPPIVLTDFRLFNRSIEPGEESILRKSIAYTDELTLTYEQSIFSFEFSSLSYVAPQRNRYRYMLDGLEKSWNEVDGDQRFVTYTTLPPGHYTFRVQGSSSSGIWNVDGVSVALTILPPWWRTWWFQLLALLLIAALVWLAYRLRVRSIRSRNRELTILNDELHRLNRELRALSDCNGALVRATDEEQLLNEICRIVCERADYRMSWVGYVDHGDCKIVRPVASAGVEEGYLETASIVWDDTGHGRGPTGTSIRTGTTAGVQDFAVDPTVATWRVEALRRGYRSCICLPLKDESNAVFGVLTIYSVKPNAFTAEEIRLLEELADDLAFGITVLRSRAERKLAEDEIRRLNAELETRVRRRTEQLEAANKDLESFSYTVSHDLRAPLRHMAAFSRILIEEYGGGLPVEAQGYVNRIEQATLRMGSLIDALLNLSRVGRQEMRLQDVSLDTLVRDVVEEMAPDCKDRQVQWKIGPLPIAKGEASLLRQVFQNVIANALKFSRDRRPAIVEIGETLQDGTHVIFVRDNGIGFDMKYADKLFGAFQRLHSEKDFPGTGIGLATVQRIIQRHGGRIWAEGKPGEGATFFFTLA